MLRFFRDIRRRLIMPDNVRKYLLYAVGEILLVVIGILIALQVNNWNEERQIIAEEQRLLKNVLLALETDSAAFEYTMSLMDDTFKVYERLYAISQDQIPADSLKNTYLMRRSIAFSPVSIKNYPELASQVIDPKVKNAVLQYYSIIETWNFVVQNYNDFIEKEMRAFLGDNGMLNYGYHHETPDEPENLLNNDVLLTALERDEVQQKLFEGTVKTRNLNGFYDRGVQRRTALIIEIKKVIK